MTVRTDADALPAATAPGLLLELARGATDAAGRAWLDAVVAGIRAPLDRDGFAAAYTVAARRVGRTAVAPAAEVRARLEAAGLPWPPEGRGADELSRAALLLRASVAVAAGELEGLVEDVYQRGDTRERQAVLRTLPLLPEPARFLPLAVEACRTSIQPLFEAIACENRYPAAHFPEPSFNQMVLKALFVGVPLARVVGLPDRITGELRRMAADYASERRAAGRPVPPDIGTLLGAPGPARPWRSR
jgi:hypothetical protein